MIRHLFNKIIHRTSMDEAYVTTVTVTDQGAFVSTRGQDTPERLQPGDSMSILMKNASISTVRFAATRWNNVAEVTSAARATKKIVRGLPPSRYLDEPSDTPSIDTSFHDHEMDV